MRGMVLRGRRWRNSAAAALFMAAPAAAQITVTDDFDRTVTIAAPAQRIVSLAPHNTENLFSAGAGARVVAVVAHSDYPPAALRIPSIGSHVQFNLEALVALNPDLVVAWESAKNRETMRKIERLGYAVYYSEPRDFEDIIENIEELAQLAGSAASIDPPVATLRAELVRLRAIVFVDADVMHRHTARMIMGIGTVCESIDQVRRGNSSPAPAPEPEQ